MNSTPNSTPTNFEAMAARRDWALDAATINALKHGRYTREAFEEHRQLQALLQQSRMLIQKIE